MSNQLLDLPSNLTPAQLATMMQDRIRDLNAILADAVYSPASAALDMGANQVNNLADPQADMDAVNFRTLKRFQGGTAIPIPEPLSTPGAVNFRLVARGFGGLDFEDVTVAGTGSDAIDFIAFAVDETDLAMSGVTGVALPANPSTDPSQIQNTYGSNGGIATGFIGRLNRNVSVGDFLLIDTEIVKVTAVSASAITIKRRHGAGAWLGSSLANHGQNAVWYKLFPAYFCTSGRGGTYEVPRQIVPYDTAAATATSGIGSRYRFEAPNLCVVAIAAATRGGSVRGPVTLFNYSNNATPVSGVTNFGTSPGFRTLSGAQYTELGVSGKLAAGAFADIFGRVAEWHSLRNAYAFLMTSGAATASLLYYAPDRSQGGIVQTFNFSGSSLSGPSATDGQQMPFGPLLQQWPPTRFPLVAMSGGRAVYPLGSAEGSIALQMDGWWDLLVTAADGTAADLACVIQV